MSNAQHTPGPWDWSGELLVKYDGTTGALGARNQEVVATFDVKNPHCDKHIQDVVRAANAHDDLLEAAKAARELGRRVYTNADAHAAPMDWAKVSQLLDAAIAKAEGDDTDLEPSEPEDPALLGDGFTDELEEAIAMQEEADEETFCLAKLTKSEGK